MTTEVQAVSDVVEESHLDVALRPRGDLVTVDIDGDAVIYDERDEQVHLLNQTAALVWRLLDGESTLTQLCEGLADAYSADIQQVRRDVRSLAEELERRGLLETVHEETGAEVGALETTTGSKTSARLRGSDLRESP